MVDFIIRQFAGKIAALIAAAFAGAVSWGFVHVAALSPAVAATIDPNAVAATLTAVFLAVMNVVANKYHLDNSTVQSIENAIKAEPPEVVVKAEPLKPAQ